MIVQGTFRRKGSDKMVTKKMNIFGRLKTVKGPPTFIRLPLVNWDISQLSEKEETRVAKLRSKLSEYGYKSDVATLSFFVISKHKFAFYWMKRYISYFKNHAYKATPEGIRRYISDDAFHGISMQEDFLLIEIIPRNGIIKTSCVYSMIHVYLTNIFRHLTIDTLRQGIRIVLDDYGYRIRLWDDRKIFYVVRVILSVLVAKDTVRVDIPRKMAKMFVTLGRAISGKQMKKIHLVRSRLPPNESNLPHLYEKFPHIKLSANFDGSDENLLPMLTSQECIESTLLITSVDKNLSSPAAQNDISTLPIMPSDVSLGHLENISEGSGSIKSTSSETTTDEPKLPKRESIRLSSVEESLSSEKKAKPLSTFQRLKNFFSCALTPKK